MAEQRKIINEFLKKYEDTIIQMTIQYTMENGPGALYVDLVPNVEELDVAYFKFNDIVNPNLKKRIATNPKRNTCVYYVIRMGPKNAFIFERDVSPN